MDATGWWEIEVPTPLGRLRFDVHVRADGEVIASHRGQRIPVAGVRTQPDGDGVRVTWVQRIAVPVRVEIGLDALLVGDRLTGTVTAEPWMRPAPLEGRRVA